MKGEESTELNNKPKQAVIIKFNYGIQGLEPLHRLEHKLEKIINDANVGEYDGHEIAVDYSDGYLYMYGPNAENLFKVVKPTIESTDFLKGGIAKLRFGSLGDDVREIEVEI